MNQLSKKRFNITATVIFFIAGLLVLNRLGDSISVYSLGIAFIIAGLYGIIAISKNKRFIF